MVTEDLKTPRIIVDLAYTHLMSIGEIKSLAT